MEIRITHKYEDIISLANLLAAWQEFVLGKKNRADVQQFSRALLHNVTALHQDLQNVSYRHSTYEAFTVYDPKQRSIHKASVRDRLLHHAIYRVLYPTFDKTFIFDSYSCRVGKGTHKAFQQLVKYSHKVAKDNNGRCWAIKMDIKKFFDSVDHEILLRLLAEKIADPNLLYILKDIIGSFAFSSDKGMPLGNLTSQLFANVYLDPLDKFVSNQLGAKYYLRYADDFLLLSPDPDYLTGCLVEINTFLKENLRLNIHPNKIHLRKFSWGIDFVGYVALPHYQVPRRKTVKRIFKKVAEASMEELEKSLLSFLGYLGHAKSHKIQRQLPKLDANKYEK